MEFSKHGRDSGKEDVDYTPRVLRVMNPNLQDETGSISSDVGSAKSKSFSFRSFSGSFSSLWRTHSTSSSDTSCIPFSLPLGRPSARTPVPSPHYSRRVPINQQHKMADDEIGGGLHRNPLQPPPMSLPAIAVAKVTTSAFVVGEDAGRRPCAYVVVDTACCAQNALQRQQRLSQRGPLANSADNEPGSLDGLRMAISIEGHCVQLWQLGAPGCPTLRVGDHWTVVVKLGLKEINLAARLSSSARSKTKNSTSLALIDQFLHTLESNSKRSEPVYVRAVVTYRHTFLPEDTMLETGSVCSVGPLTTTSPTTTLANGTLQNAVIRALDPGTGYFLNLNSKTRSENHLPITFPPTEAMKLIEDFRHVFDKSLPRAVETDLASLDAYYYFKRHNGHTPVKTSAFRISVRRAKRAMSKLSMKKKTNVN